MLRHLIRFAFLLAILAAAALAGAALLERTEPVAVEWSGWILETQLWVIVVAGAVALIAGWVVIALLLGAIRAPRSIRRAVYARRRERGILALGQAFTAFTAEDSKAALANARRAERLLGDSRITRPLVAKSLEMSGLTREAKEYFDALAANRDTAESGARGLLTAAKMKGDTEAAIAQARRVISLHPSDASGHRELFELLARKKSWREAREALSKAVRHRAYSKEDAQRLEATAFGAEAEEAYGAGDARRARKCAQRAAELDPSLAAPACLAAQLLAREGDRKRAERLILAAWRAQPVPELAAAWSALEPLPAAGELARKHLLRLADANPSHPESRLVAAEVAVTAHDWNAARTALGDLPMEAPTARACAAMAAIEKAGNGNTTAAQVWLARALDAPRGSYWTCSGCGCILGRWHATCPECASFGSVARRKAAPTSGHLAASAIAPLIEGRKPGASAELRTAAELAASSELIELPQEDDRQEPFARPDA